MDITAEITVKFRLAIKKKLAAMKIEEDDDLIDFVMIIFARKKRFDAIREDLEELLEEKTADFAVWLDLLIQKVNGLPEDPSREMYEARKRKEQEKLEERLEAEQDAREAAAANSGSDSSESSDSDGEGKYSRDRSRSRSRSRSPPKNRVNIFLEDSRQIHDLQERFQDLKQKSRRLNKEFTKREDKNSKKLCKSYKGINEALMKLLEACDAVELDPKDIQNRADRKKIIKDSQKLLDRNDKAISFL